MQPRIVVLTGAGISAESGLRTFRDHDGLWEGERVEDVATPEAYARNPAKVHAFYNQRRVQLQQPQVMPNAAHLALAQLEAAWPGSFLLVTQNVDNLHERAGSRQVLHMHGELLCSRCTHCAQVSTCKHDLNSTSSCNQCHTRGSLRPHIVWFGEVPMHMDAISAALEHCEVFIAVGTSGAVYPAAGFVRTVPAACRKIEANMRGTHSTDAFAEHWTGPAGQQVPALVAALLNDYGGGSDG